MTALFTTVRFYTLIFVFLFSIVVLGLAANFAKVFLPLHRDYLIFAIVVPAVSMIAVMVIALRSQPRVELIVVFVLSILWLALGGYSTDVIGYRECDAQSGTIPAKNGSTYSAQGYCRQQKVIQSFAWANFFLLAVTFITLLALTLRAHGKGYKAIWAGSVSELAWFDEESSDQEQYQHHQHQQQQVQYAPVQGQTYMYPANYGGNQPVYQLPGHSVVISNGANGQVITQVPVDQAPTASG